MKLPILNKHKCEGIYDSKIPLCPNHYCWIPHIILGMLSILFPKIVLIFLVYQISQMIKKGEMWDDIVDIMEFNIGMLISFFLKKMGFI